MKNKGLIVLLLIFVLMFILNTFTPLLSDDYFSAFVYDYSGCLVMYDQNYSNFIELYI